MPLGGRAQHAPHLTETRQVTAIAGLEREILPLAGQERRAGLSGASRAGTGGAGRPDAVRFGEPVVRIWPVPGLLRVIARGLDLRCERRELIAAPLADHGERLPVPDQPQRYLVRLPGLVMTRDSSDAEQRAIYAA